MLFQKKALYVQNWTEIIRAVKHRLSDEVFCEITRRNESNSNGHTLFLRQVNSNNPEVGDCSQGLRPWKLDCNPYGKKYFK